MDPNIIVLTEKDGILLGKLPGHQYLEFGFYCERFQENDKITIVVNVDLKDDIFIFNDTIGYENLKHIIQFFQRTDRNWNLKLKGTVKEIKNAILAISNNYFVENVCIVSYLYDN